MNAITIWRPRRGMLSLRDPFDRMFEDMTVFPSRVWLAPFEAAMPALDVYTEDGSLIVKAEVPGIASDELEVNVKDNVLTISGETKAEEEFTEENYIRRERRYGSFCRSVALPDGAEGDKAEASFEGGVLTVTVPVAEEAETEPVKIPVKES
ncbi:MAG: Hsp20/alpha crystallin family protein [Anaerolineae bacterium]|nr:Hsp20/alpha crystallin family protein [Anaerolineae bacterium]